MHLCTVLRHGLIAAVQHTYIIILVLDIFPLQPYNFRYLTHFCRFSRMLNLACSFMRLLSLQLFLRCDFLRTRLILQLYIFL